MPARPPRMEEVAAEADSVAETAVADSVAEVVAAMAVETVAAAADMTEEAEEATN